MVSGFNVSSRTYIVTNEPLVPGLPGWAWREEQQERKGGQGRQTDVALQFPFFRKPSL